MAQIKFEFKKREYVYDNVEELIKDVKNMLSDIDNFKEDRGAMQQDIDCQQEVLKRICSVLNDTGVLSICLDQEIKNFETIEKERKNKIIIKNGVTRFL
jgi:hypothetical protein